MWCLNKNYVIYCCLSLRGLCFLWGHFGGHFVLLRDLEPRNLRSLAYLIWQACQFRFIGKPSDHPKVFRPSKTRRLVFLGFRFRTSGLQNSKWSPKKKNSLLLLFILIHVRTSFVDTFFLITRFFIGKPTRILKSCKLQKSCEQDPCESQFVLPSL